MFNGNNKVQSANVNSANVNSSMNLLFLFCALLLECILGLPAYTLERDGGLALLPNAGGGGRGSFSSHLSLDKWL